MRTARAMRNAELLLAGLVNNSVHPITGRPFYGYWVRLPGGDHRTAYLQPYYHCEILESSTDDFSPAGVLCRVVPPHELFGPYSMSAGTPFTVPEGLDDVLGAYHTLSTAVQEQFLRSCYWLQRANRSFLESFSAAFMAVVIAAEVLFESKSANACGCCGQPRYRLRSSFSELLETYVPLADLTSRGRDEQSSFQARLRHLYDTRSKITHGSDLRAWDTGSHAFTPLGTQDDDDLRTLLRIMPLALANWLRERATTKRPSESLESSRVTDSA
jgi:hypothetical protein